MNKAQLIETLSHQFDGSKKEAAKAVDAVIDTIMRAVVAGEKVAIAGFGNFDKVVRKARTARNPLTGATVKVKATSVPKFKPALQFKEVGLLECIGLAYSYPRTFPCHARSNIRASQNQLFSPYKEPIPLEIDNQGATTYIAPSSS